ncbi:MAG: hypothetical protein LBT15_04325 [Synergistaceae bacterium]|nr:hypothetical protein [Synergistaceae bacterium]
MAELILVICGAVFLFGLVQWARGGAILWDIVRFSRRRPGGGKNGAADTDEEKKAAEIRSAKAMRDMERMVDGLLRSSFRVLGVLALFVWLFVAASVVIDALGLDWLDNLSFRANRLWGDPTVRSGYATQSGGAPRGNGNILRSLGSGLRR